MNKRGREYRRQESEYRIKTQEFITKARKHENKKEEGSIYALALFRAFQVSCFRDCFVLDSASVSRLLYSAVLSGLILLFVSDMLYKLLFGNSEFEFRICSLSGRGAVW
jgi:hypothetical protein